MELFIWMLIILFTTENKNSFVLVCGSGWCTLVSWIRLYARRAFSTPSQATGNIFFKYIFQFFVFIRNERCIDHFGWASISNGVELALKQKQKVKATLADEAGYFRRTYMQWYKGHNPWSDP